MHKKFLIGVAAAAVLALGVSNALAQKAYGPGVTDKEIKIGQSVPLSGPAVAFGNYGHVMAGYFNMLNEKGGINGRKVEFIMLDNAYSPPKAIEQSRKLVEDMGVLAEVGTVGTVPNIAIQKYLNDKKVPQLLISAGGARFNNPKEYPWTIPLYPNFGMEGEIAAKFVLSVNPNAKIGFLYQNDDFGKDYMIGFKKGLGDKASQVVSAQPYEMSDATIDSQILKLKAAGVDTLVESSTPKFTAQAIRKAHELGWTPMHLIGGAVASIPGTLKPAGLDASKGLITTQFIKEPGDPAWANDAETLAYNEFMKKYVPKIAPTDHSGLSGYVTAEAIALVLKKAGDNLTRENLIKVATTALTGERVEMLLPGIKINISPNDYSAYNGLRMAKFDGENWVLLGDVVTAK